MTNEYVPAPDLVAAAREFIRSEGDRLPRQHRSAARRAERQVRRPVPRVAGRVRGAGSDRDAVGRPTRRSGPQYRADRVRLEARLPHRRWRRRRMTKPRKRSRLQRRHQAWRRENLVLSGKPARPRAPRRCTGQPEIRQASGYRDQSVTAMGPALGRGLKGLAHPPRLRRTTRGRPTESRLHRWRRVGHH